jgi:hypothetical protein
VRPDIYAGIALPPTLYGEGRPQSRGLLRFVDFCMFEARRPDYRELRNNRRTKDLLNDRSAEPVLDTYLAQG